MESYKKIINYFKRWDGAHMLGIGTMIVGFLSLWLGGAFSYIMYFIGGPVLIAGFLIFLYGNMGRANENELTEIIKTKREAVSFEGLEDDRHFKGRIPRILREEICEGYDFNDNEELLIKQQISRVIISSQYTTSKLAILQDAFYIKAKTFSFISPDYEDKTYEIFFDQVEKIEVKRWKAEYRRGKKAYPVKHCALFITYDGGKQLILPRRDDIYADGLVETLQFAIIDAKKKNN